MWGIILPLELKLHQKSDHHILEVQNKQQQKSLLYAPLLEMGSTIVCNTPFCKLVGIYCCRLETGTSSCLYKDESRALHCWFPTPPARSQGGEQKWGTLIQTLRSPPHEPNSCTSSSPEKRWTPSWGGDACSLSPAETFHKSAGLTARAPLTNTTYTPTPFPISLGELFPPQVLSPLLQSSFCPKENLTHNSHMAHFFKLTPLHIQYTIL